MKRTVDLGLNHVGYMVRDLDASIEFYSKYAALEVFHERRDGTTRVAWMRDGERLFVLVLVAPARMPLRLRVMKALGRLAQTFPHLGVACSSQEEVDARARLAKEEGCLTKPPRNLGSESGYAALVTDPDGYFLEITFGQRVESRIRELDGA